MKSSSDKNSNSIDRYIAGYPPKIQLLLNQVKSAIEVILPEAEQTLKYGMPTFRMYDHNVVHFAPAKNHIGFYPTPSAIVAFEKELKSYVTSKGAIQFPIDKPMPLKLIQKITAFRLKETELKKRPGMKTCSNGHVFQKTSDCPVCPKCEAAKKGKSDFMPQLSAPARRALENAGIKNMKKLSKYTKDELLQLHGMGPSSLPKIESALKAEGMELKG